MKVSFLKSIDEKLSDIGFVKESETKYGAIYTRYNNDFNFTQVVHITHKASGKHILQSYDRTDGKTVVGLTYYELKLFTKKMARLGLRSK